MPAGYSDLKNEIVERVKSALGYPVIEVYTEDDTIAQQVDIALQKFSSRVFKSSIINLPPQKYHKLESDNIAYVQDVVPILPDMTENSLYTKDEFSLYESYLIFNQMGVGITSPLLMNMFKRQLGTTFNAKFDWKYNKYDGSLYVDNIPPGTKGLTVFLKEYFSLEELPHFALDWFYRYTLALTKSIEGRIRSKYAESIAGAPTDGPALITEAREEMVSLEEQLESFVTYDIGSRY